MLAEFTIEIPMAAILMCVVLPAAGIGWYCLAVSAKKAVRSAEARLKKELGKEVADLSGRYGLLVQQYHDRGRELKETMDRHALVDSEQSRKELAKKITEIERLKDLISERVRDNPLYLRSLRPFAHEPPLEALYPGSWKEAYLKAHGLLNYSESLGWFRGWIDSSVGALALTAPGLSRLAIEKFLEQLVSSDDIEEETAHYREVRGLFPCSTEELERRVVRNNLENHLDSLYRHASVALMNMDRKDRNATAKALDASAARNEVTQARTTATKAIEALKTLRRIERGGECIDAKRRRSGEFLGDCR